ncbi:imm11 family protein [Pyxidicoccus sp. 3LG]
MQSEYFVLLRARSQQHPLLSWGQSYRAFLKGRPVEVLEPVKLKLGEPVPPRPVMADHHSLPSPVVSSRLKDTLEVARLPGVQFVPADIQVGDEVLRYWLVHMWRRIACVDRERSVLTLYPTDGSIMDIDRLVLDENVLREIPLQERLAFRLQEDVVHLFHSTVVERVMSLTPPPEGLRFVPVPEWNDSAGFR